LSLQARRTRRSRLGLFARFGVSAERVELDDPAEHAAFLERYADIDLALDTFPYNGGTTTEASRQGVPVIALAGDRWAARINASILREAGLSDARKMEEAKLQMWSRHCAQDSTLLARWGSAIRARHP
jgi:predicted O-linked N-acetylglucosamine transferase (SPINDLY family)